jgi:murein DD-endopeptidase MepM/ murein hydrolase activator NlpD
VNPPPAPPPPPPPGAPTTAPVAPAPAPTPEPTVAGPVGFPVDPNLRPLRVDGPPQGRRLLPPAPDGPTILQVARDIFPRPANDEESNRHGWNCRTHEKHEGYPGVDWYLEAGTPVVATMDGKAELYVIFVPNAFSYYGVNANLYLGLPPPNLPLYPFNGPGGGMGVFVSVFDGVLRAEYGHLSPKATINGAPDNSFVRPYSKSYDYEANFSRPLGPNDGTLVATWPVKKGQVVGFVGNSGYSDVPHLHYQVITPDRKVKYCPSDEDGYRHAGWLFRHPTGFPGY